MRIVAALLSVLVAVMVGWPWRHHAARPRSDRSNRATARRTVAFDARSVRPVAAGVAFVFGYVVAGPVCAVAAAAATGLVPPAVDRLRDHRRRAAVAIAAPDLIDLFLVAASAGQTVAGSLAVVAARAPTAVVGAVLAASDRFRRGLPLSECLGELGAALGPDGPQLADALRQAASAGVPLVPLLEGVAATARDRRRRRAQEVARRLPVTMLFPMVACILPAAILLAVVPVLLVSISSLSP